MSDATNTFLEIFGLTAVFLFYMISAEFKTWYRNRNKFKTLNALERFILDEVNDTLLALITNDWHEKSTSDKMAKSKELIDFVNGRLKS